MLKVKKDIERLSQRFNIYEFKVPRYADLLMDTYFVDNYAITDIFGVRYMCQYYCRVNQMLSARLVM